MIQICCAPDDLMARLRWAVGQKTVKTLEKQYMRAQLAKAGTPGPKAIGIDEISIRKATPTASW